MLQKDKIKEIRFKNPFWGSVLLAATTLLCCRCFSFHPELTVNGYEQQDEGERVVLSIWGKRFGHLGTAQILVNQRDISPGHLLKWSDNEIQIFILKPFAYATVQLKRGHITSQYIPVWNEDSLPQVQQNRQVKDFPVLETFKLISSRPPILEIRGQNFGFRYQDQLLLFSRQIEQRPNLYFDPAKLEQYRILQMSEVLSWGNQLIRLKLPQEVVQGSVFLVRTIGGSLQSSNSLFIPAARNRNAQQAGRKDNFAEDALLRLNLQLASEVLPSPILQISPDILAEPEKTEEGLYQKLLELREQYLKKQVGRSGQLHSSQSGDADVFRRLLQLKWPRNELYQRWHNLRPIEAPNGLVSDVPSKSNNSIVLPVLNLSFLPVPPKAAQKYGRSCLLHGADFSRIPLAGKIAAREEIALLEKALYLDFSYASWLQEPPANSKSQTYNWQELKQLAYQLQSNRAILQAYEVPSWTSVLSLKDGRLSPYEKAVELYKRAVRELKLSPVYLSDSLHAELGLQITSWLCPAGLQESELRRLLIRSWPQERLNEAGNLQLSENDNNTQWAPEQILLLLLRGFTELDIPARIISGAQAQLPLSPQGTSNLHPYFWLEIYLPDFGWFQFDPLAELLAYQADPGAFDNGNIPLFWGRLLQKLQPGQPLKLAFFPLGEIWQSFDSQLQQLPDSMFSWQLHRLR